MGSRKVGMRATVSGIKPSSEDGFALSSLKGLVLGDAEVSLIREELRLPRFGSRPPKLFPIAGTRIVALSQCQWRVVERAANADWRRDDPHVRHGGIPAPREDGTLPVAEWIRTRCWKPRRGSSVRGFCYVEWPAAAPWVRWLERAVSANRILVRDVDYGDDADLASIGCMLNQEERAAVFTRRRESGEVARAAERMRVAVESWSARPDYPWRKKHDSLFEAYHAEAIRLVRAFARGRRSATGRRTLRACERVVEFIDSARTESYVQTQTREHEQMKAYEAWRNDMLAHAGKHIAADAVDAQATAEALLEIGSDAADVAESLRKAAHAAHEAAATLRAENETEKRKA